MSGWDDDARPDLTPDELFGPDRGAGLGDPAAQDELRHRLLGDPPPDRRPGGLLDVSDLTEGLGLR